MFPRLFILPLVLLVISVSCAYAETEARNAFCPIEPTEAALPEYSAEYGSKTYYFCCSECVEMFTANPSKYVDLEEDGNANLRSPFQLWFDGIWNAAHRTPGLSLGALAILALIVIRTVMPKLRPLLGMKSVAAIVTLSLGGEALSAHQLRRKDAREYEESQLIHQVHFSTFHEYGDPPIPARPELPPRLHATFYRGNDERSSRLFNRGYYRTCDFVLDLCNSAGEALGYGSRLTPDESFLRIRVVRAPGTPDFFWTPDRMANIFASRSAEKLLGRDGKAVADAVPMQNLRPMWEWEMRYPLSSFARDSKPERLKGIVYHCEKRFGTNDVQIGSRFHYAFQFDLILADGIVQEESDLWMGATYRNRVLRIWEIPQREWLSTEPIPVIEGENLTTDPKLLGIEGHVLDQN